MIRMNRSKKHITILIIVLTIITVICACVLLLLLRSENTPISEYKSAPIAELARRNAISQYTLHLAYDEQAHTISGYEKINIRNTSGETWDSLCLNDRSSSSVYTESPNGGLTELTECIITFGESCFDIEPIRSVDNPCIITFPLSTPLKSGETLCLEMNVVIHVPQGNDRFGFNDTACNLGGFIPQVALWKNNGWVIHPFVGFGESSVSECADYSLTLTAPKGLTVVCTGESVTEKGITTANAKNVRDFCIVISKGWHVAERQYGDVLIRVYYKGNFIMGKEALDAACDALDTIGGIVGTYPYTTLDIVGTDICYGGVEYPQLIMMSHFLFDWSFDFFQGYVHDHLRTMISHEVAHQWFYGVIGNDQYVEPWIDEGFSTYLEHVCAKNAGIHQAGGYADINLPLDSSMKELENLSYVYVVGAAFLTELQEIIGDDVFYNMLHNMYINYGYGLADSESILQMIRNSTPGDKEDEVDTLIMRYFQIQK